MSYDVTFKAKVEGTDCYVEVGDCDANITWNVREIITRSTGLEWRNEENNGPCIDVIPKIHEGLFELQTNGEKYKQYEAKNGWGTVRDTIRFFTYILNAWGDLVAYSPELAKVATFWVE